MKVQHKNMENRSIGVSRQCRWGNAAAIDGLDGPNRQDGQDSVS